MIRAWFGGTGLLAVMVAVTGCGGGGGGNPPEPGVSGIITIESRTRVDSDTADDSRVSEAVSNNSQASAQLLPTTGTVGGYLSFTSGSYPNGGEFTFNYVIDSQDYYRINLSEGDRVALQVFQASGLAEPGVRMEILDERDTLVFDSNKIQGPPFTKVMEASDVEFAPHTVRLSTSSGGPFRYVLTVAAEGTASVMNTAYAEPEFRLDEAVVAFKPGAMAQANTAGVASSLAVAGARNLGGGAWKVTRAGQGDVKVLSAPERKARRTETLNWIRELGQRPDVAVAEPNYIYHAQAVNPDDDPLYPRQWHYPLINLPVAWQAAPNAGSNVGVAVLDTGLFSMTPGSFGNWHPDIHVNVITFTGGRPILDYVSGDLDIDNEPGRDTNPADPGDGKSQSSNFHGTHVAGIVAAVDNTEGVVSVAPQSTLWPVRVLGRDGSGSLDDLIAAVNWAATQTNIHVINLSLGGVGPSTTLRTAIDTAFDKGKLVVAAAGNQNSDELTYPAAFERVVGVGAVDGAKVRASYSNIGGSVDLVAPGGDASRDANLDGNADLIISTWGFDDGGSFEPGYAGLQGTSMAAPHVAGIFALMKAVEPSIDAQGFFALLANGDLTENVGNETEYGAGLIDALKAVDAALEGDIPTVLGASPTVLQFSSALVSQQLAFTRHPSDAKITVQGVTIEVDWLNVGGELAAGSEPPDSVDVSVDTKGLEPDKTFSTDLLIDYNSADNAELRTLAIPITMQLGDPADERNAGRHYVLLVSTDDSRETVEQAVVNASGGEYSFAFSNIESGEYFLVAGTDMDNNGFICESGEACAEYPVNGSPEKIVIGDAPISGVTLNTSFRRPTISSLGAPRIGFEGYRLKDHNAQPGQPAKRVESR